MKSDVEKAKELLVQLAEAGKLELDDIKEIKGELDSARRRYFTNKRSPESYRKAAEKAKATRERSELDRSDWIKKAEENSNSQERERLARREKGYLPQTISGYALRSGENISRELYKESPYDHSGYGYYHLYPEYSDLVVDAATAKFYWGLY